MVDASQIKEHAEVIGADGVHVGTVDHVDGDRIKLTKNDSPQSQDGQGAKHHYISLGLVAEIEGDKVRLSATGANALCSGSSTSASATASPSLVTCPASILDKSSMSLISASRSLLEAWMTFA